MLEFLELKVLRTKVESAKKSLKSYIAGIRNYEAFFKLYCSMFQVTAVTMLAVYPPHVDVLCKWATIHANIDTFIQYCAHVKWLCVFLEFPVEVFSHPSLKQLIAWQR